jgi:AraC-like DNA-binding protein
LFLERGPLTFEIINLLQWLLAAACLTAGLILAYGKRLRPLAALLCVFAAHMAFNVLEETRGLPNGLLITPAFGFAYGPLIYLFVRRFVVAAPLEQLQTALHFVVPVVALLSAPWIEIVRVGAAVSLMAYGFVTLRTISRYHAETASSRSDAASIRLSWVTQVFAGFAALTVIDAFRIFTQHLQSPVVATATYASVLTAAGGLLGALVWRAVTQPDYFKGLSHPPGRSIRTPAPVGPDDADRFRRIEQSVLSAQLHRRPHLTLSDVASATNLTEREVSSAINSVAKRPFCDYINAMRVRDVCKALDANGESTVLEVAFDAGFTSKSSFNAVFKREIGVTPTEYRRRNTSKP